MDQEKILVVDDDEGLLHLLKMRLTALGFSVMTCSTGHEAVEEARRQLYDLAITDLRLNGEDGLQITEQLLLTNASLPILIMTAHGSIPNAVEAMQRGAFGYLTKPFDDRELKAQIEKALQQQRMSREIRRLKQLVKELYGMENVVGRSQKMQVLFQAVAQVSETDATICLSGETGTGKEVVARVMHCNSRRSKGPFVAINCGAVPETLFESELFGYVRGAFTGSHGSKLGLFQSANGGTLFLDEIAEMPLPMQVKLLRAIQEKEVRELGAEHPTKVDVRIIAATNKDLNQAVQVGSFRSDLYYRVNVVPLTIPPLRERRDDIPLLAQHFLEQSRQRIGKDMRGFSPAAMQKLMLYPWPGNVRELENVIEKAVILSRQDMIGPELIPSMSASGQPSLQPLTEAKEAFEKKYLKEVLELSNGNISRAAQVAGRYRADFYKMLKKYNLHPSGARLKPEPDLDHGRPGADLSAH